jgi:predicted RNA-binding Zn-ribbon protein involved in translation (DUF1610 family)
MENKKLDTENMEQVAGGGYTMGYDPRIMDCPHCGHHMLKRIKVDDTYVTYKCNFCGQISGEHKWSTD